MEKIKSSTTSIGLFGLLLSLILYCQPNSCYGNLATEKEKRDCIIEVASSQVGELEIGGNNRGPAVKRYCSVLGLGEGLAWCGCFVKWVFETVGIPTPGGNAWSPSWFPKDKIIFTRGDHTKKLEEVAHGDLASLFYQKLGRIGHVAIVKSMDEKWTETIDGNTNFAGARDSETGDGVHLKKRPTKTIYKIARWIPKERSDEFSFLR